MLNSAEHEICPAVKSLLTIANSFLLNIAEHENFSANKYENANYSQTSVAQTSLGPWKFVRKMVGLSTEI